MIYYDIVKYDPVNNYTLFNLDQLKKLKQTITKENLEEYQKDMETLFDAPLETVISKKSSPFSDLHEYVSLATYYWPNPDTKDGYPYLQKDGYANPDGVNYDKDKLRRLAYLTYHMAILTYLTEDFKYVHLLEKHVHHFFINPKTRMNPNMNGGQYIPGKNTGRKEGIIDYTANFTYALNMIMNLAAVNLISKTLVEELKQWHEKLLEWLVTSEIGVAEAKAVNNHGTFYDLGCCVIARFTNNQAIIDHFKDRFEVFRLDHQIMKDGSLPLELKRTKSLSYSLMGLKGLLELSEIFEIGKKKIETSIDWLLKTAFSKTKWPYEQVTEYDPGINLLFLDLIKNYDHKYDQIKMAINYNQVINKTLYYIYQGEENE